jgi:hypothetical protein
VVTRGARLLGIGIDVRWRARDRAARARHAAHRRAAAAPGARFRRCRGGADGRPRIADSALTRLEVDALGLDAMDRRYLMMIADIYKGGPVGVETLAAGLSEPRDTIEEVIEPYLIQLGLIARTARGRCLNAGAGSISASIRLDDDLIVVSRMERVSGATVTIAQQVMRGEVLLTEAAVTVAFITPEGRPKRQPRAWVEIYKSITNGEPVLS